MDQIYGTIIIVLLVLLFLALGRSGGMRREAGEELEEVNDSRRNKIEDDKEKIVKKIESEGRITNDDVQQLLRVSDATATRRLQELEDEDEIEQRGKGKNTYYVEAGQEEEGEEEEDLEQD